MSVRVQSQEMVVEGGGRGGDGFPRVLGELLPKNGGADRGRGRGRWDNEKRGRGEKKRFLLSEEFIYGMKMCLDDYYLL